MGPRQKILDILYIFVYQYHSDIKSAFQISYENIQKFVDCKLQSDKCALILKILCTYFSQLSKPFNPVYI